MGRKCSQLKIMIKVVITICIVLIMFTGCVVNELDDSHQTIILSKEIQGREVTIEVIKGENYSELMGIGPVKFNVIPQTVVWVETMEGEYIETLYITGAHGVKFNHGKKGELGENFYVKCLPVWASRVKAKGANLPSKENPYTTAVTSATPMSSFTAKTTLKETIYPFKILLEINKSGDDNNTYNKNNNDWAGQPSLIYSAVISDNTYNQTFYLQLIGHGGMLKDQTDIYDDLSGFDSALTQLQQIRVTLN
jgi:hypothetical protein